MLKDLLWPLGTFVETGGADPTSAEMDADLKKVRERLGKGGRESVWCWREYVCVKERERRAFICPAFN